MESCAFPAASGTCICQSGQFSYWDNGLDGNNFASSSLQDTSQFSLPETTPQANTGLFPSYPSLLPIDPALWPQTDSELRPASFPQQQAVEDSPDSSSWFQRLKRLEMAIEQQDPTTLHHQPDWSRLDKLEQSMEGLQLKVNQHQQAISNLESWAEMMKTAYKEFKGAVYEVYKLVNSRKHLLAVLGPSTTPNPPPSRKCSARLRYSIC